MGYCVFDGCTDLVLSITPGNDREAFARKYSLPFMPKGNSSSSDCSRSTIDMLRDVMCEIVSDYGSYRQKASELPSLMVPMREERPFPWMKEGGRWV